MCRSERVSESKWPIVDVAEVDMAETLVQMMLLLCLLSGLGPSNGHHQVGKNGGRSGLRQLQGSGQSSTTCLPLLIVNL